MNTYLPANAHRYRARGLPWMSTVCAIITCSLSGPTVSAAEEPPLWSSKLAFDAGATHQEKWQEQSGELTNQWLVAEGRLFFRPHPALRLGVGLGFSADSYQVDGDAPQQALPDAVSYVWLRVPLAVMFHPHWGITLQASLGSGTDDHTAMRAGRQWQVQGGPLYVRDDNLIIALLVNVSSNLDGSPRIFPFPSVYWHFADVWHLTVVDEVDNLSHLTYEWQEHLQVGLRIDVRLRQAALNDDRTLSDDHVGSAVEAIWQPTGKSSFQITPFIGALLVRRLTLHDQTTDQDTILTSRPAPMLGLNVRAEF